MIIDVPKAHITVQNGKMVGKTSTMGLPPGVWPDSIRCYGFVFQRGTPMADGRGYHYNTRDGGVQLLVYADN